jgi:hypothetical protein
LAYRAFNFAADTQSPRGHIRFFFNRSHLLVGSAHPENMLRKEEFKPVLDRDRIAGLTPVSWFQKMTETGLRPI